MRWRRARRVTAALVVLALCACAQSGLERTTAAAARLTPEAEVYVAIPPDGRFLDHAYPGSGLRIATLVARTLEPWIAAVEVASDAQTPAAALASARAGGFDYVAVTEILRWEDRSGVWSGLPDAAEIRIALIETRTGHPADIAILTTGNGTRRHADIPANGRGTPEDLLAGALVAHIEKLFLEHEPGAAHAAR